MAPLRQRFLAILGLMVGAPVCAEYLQAYLPDTGDAAVMLGGLLILGPLYGGAALLIRETALRTGRGWPGVLLMAAAFGLLMTSQVDGSMWLAHDPEIAYWDDLRAGTLVGPLGFAVYPVLTWVIGHVVFSIGAPLALLDALAPRRRGRPLLGKPGLMVVGGLCLTAALLIRGDPEYDGAAASPAQTWLSLLVAIALIGLALSPIGRPLTRNDRAGTRWTPPRTLAVGVVGLLVLDLLPFTWVGTALYVTALGFSSWGLLRVSRTRAWGRAQVTALAVAAIVERTLIGFVAPLPPGVGGSEKLVQSLVLSGLVALVAIAAWRRSAQDVEGPRAVDVPL